MHKLNPPRGLQLYDHTTRGDGDNKRNADSAGKNVTVAVRVAVRLPLEIVQSGLQLLIRVIHHRYLWFFFFLRWSVNQ